MVTVDGCCTPLSSETKPEPIDCYKQLVCNLLACLESALCVDGKFDWENVDEQVLFDCLGAALCSALRCIPEVLCPPELQPTVLCAPRHCCDGFAVEENPS